MRYDQRSNGYAHDILPTYRCSEEKMIRADLDHGFVGTALEAYNKHHKLVLRPDDVWLAIVQGLNGMMLRKGMAELWRPLFVSHTGKLKLTAFGGGSLLTADYEALASQIAEKIEETTVGEWRHWFEPGFSTTTPIDRQVARLTMMATLQKYFSYEFILMCGLPEVTLEGSVADWEDVRRRADKLLELPGLGSWHARLTPVLDEFVLSAQGRPSLSFWNRIATSQSMVSGSPWITGWITVFLPADARFSTEPNTHPWDERHTTTAEEAEWTTRLERSGHWGFIYADKVPLGTVSVPVTICDNDCQVDVEFEAGFTGVKVDPEDPTRGSPGVGWLFHGVEPDYEAAAALVGDRDAAFVGRPPPEFLARHLDSGLPTVGRQRLVGECGAC